MFRKRKGKKTNTGGDDSSLYTGFSDDMFPYTGTEDSADAGFGDDIYPSVSSDAGADMGFGDDVYPSVSSDAGADVDFGDDIYPSVGSDDSGLYMGFGDESDLYPGTEVGNRGKKRNKGIFKWIAAAIVLIVICGIVFSNSDKDHSESVALVVNITKAPPERTQPTATPAVRMIVTATPTVRTTPTATPIVRTTPTPVQTGIVGKWQVTGGFRNAGTTTDVYYEFRSDGTLFNTYEGKNYTYRYRMDGSDRILIDYGDGNGYCHPNANGTIIIQGNEMIWSLASGADASKDEYVWTKFRRV